MGSLVRRPGPSGGAQGGLPLALGWHRALGSAKQGLDWSIPLGLLRQLEGQGGLPQELGWHRAPVSAALASAAEGSKHWGRPTATRGDDS